MPDTERKTYSPTLEFITFHIGEEEYCVDIMAVREIRGWTRATALPHAPHYVSGVINLRGTVLPIIDLAARLGVGATEPTSRHVIIVLQVEGQVVGLLADAVSDIMTVKAEEMHATPNVDSETAKLFVKGILAVDERMIRQIDVAKVFPAQQQQDAAPPAAAA